MYKLFISAAVIFLLSVVMAGSLSAQGKSNQAPGQTKTEAKGMRQATVGTVEQVTNSTITIEDKKAKKKTEAEITTSTKIVGGDKKLVKLGAIKLKDLIALVSTESAGTASLSAKLKKVTKVFVKEASQSAQLKRRAVAGVITAIDGAKITLAHQINRDRIFSVITTANTIIHQKSSTEASGSATLASLQVGQRIAAVGDLDGNGAIIAKRIHIIPGRATGVFKKNPLATPSASATVSQAPIASSSAIPLPSATPIP